MPVWNILPKFPDLFLTTTLQNNYYHIDFKARETEAQQSEGMFPKPYHG